MGWLLKLTPKQRRFVQEYLICLNATEAAKRAGYSEKVASVIGFENLKKPKIKQLIDETLESIATEKVASITEILEFLTSVMRGECTEQIPLLIGEGIQKLANKDIGAKERLKAAELIGKRYGLFSDKVNLEGTLPVMIVDAVPEDW